MSLVLSKLWGIKVNFNLFPEKGNFSVFTLDNSIPEVLKGKVYVRSCEKKYLNLDLTEDFLNRLMSVNLLNSKVRLSMDYLSCNPTGLPHAGNLLNGVQGDLFKILFVKSGLIKVNSLFFMNDRGQQLSKFKKAVLNNIPGYSLPDQHKHILLTSNWEDKVTQYWEPLIMNEARQLKINFDQVVYQSELYRDEFILLLRLSLPFLYLHEGVGKYLMINNRKVYLIGNDGQLKYLTSDLCLQLRLSRLGYDVSCVMYGGEQDNHFWRLRSVLRLLKVPLKFKVISLSRLSRLGEDNSSLGFSKRRGIITLDLPESLPLRFFLASFHTTGSLNVVSRDYIEQVLREYNQVRSAHLKLTKLPMLSNQGFMLQRYLIGWLDAKFNSLIKGNVRYIYMLLINLSSFINSNPSLSKFELINLYRLWLDLLDFYLPNV